MIFGSVGTHTAPFDRLVRALDGYAEQTSEGVVIQIGHATYAPRAAEWFRMTGNDQMAAFMRAADVVVTQAADTMLEAIRARKRIVAVPRQRGFSEAIDDHQVELARKLAATIGIVVVEDISHLPSILAAGVGPTATARNGEPERLVETLRLSIMELTRHGTALAAEEPWS